MILVACVYSLSFSTGCNRVVVNLWTGWEHICRSTSSTAVQRRLDLLLPSPMSSSDADRVVGRTSQFPTTRRSGALSPSLSASLTDQHLAEALANSPDNGATLDFTHKSLTDVGEDGAERLATAGRSEFSTEQAAITRSAPLLRHANAAN
jgi:hypothetical protein